MTDASMTLRTPEQVAAHLGTDDAGEHLVSPFTIRRLVREKKVACTKLARGRVMFTEPQIAAMVAHLEQPIGSTTPGTISTANTFTPSARSRSSRRSG